MYAYVCAHKVHRALTHVHRHTDTYMHTQAQTDRQMRTPTLAWQNPLRR